MGGALLCLSETFVQVVLGTSDSDWRLILCRYIHELYAFQMTQQHDLF